LKDVSFSLEAGESLAIVGCNGSGKFPLSHCGYSVIDRFKLHFSLDIGKSTLAKVLLRMVDFDRGELAVNGVDIRRLSPADYHRHVTTVFQGFSKYNTTVKENVGLGYVQKLQSQTAVSRAIHLGGADSFVDDLPNGIKTKLDTSGFDGMTYTASSSAAGFGTPSRQYYGLSGGEVRLMGQRNPLR